MEQRAEGTHDGPVKAGGNSGAGRHKPVLRCDDGRPEGYGRPIADAAFRDTRRPEVLLDLVPKRRKKRRQVVPPPGRARDPSEIRQGRTDDERAGRYLVVTGIDV